MNLTYTLINYIDCGIMLFLGALIVILIAKTSPKNKTHIVFFVCYILMGILYYFGLVGSCMILILFLVSYLTYYFVSSENRITELFNKFRRKNRLIGNNDEKDEFYNCIEETVVELSKSKTGALLTFEKHENLDDYIQKGKLIHCKVNSDLLRTIFYVGTPLHDGAVIIRDNYIEAASVYYSPATKAMPGKFGARHRAAIGFSEEHSSITVIVSEETGRINFAINGELVPANHENFKKRFIDLMKK